MSVMLTSEAEKERLANRVRPKWGLLTTTSIAHAVHFARDNGWADKKVQVRVEKTYTDVVEYIVEPYEEGCGCSGILKYQDYFRVEEIK